MLCCARVPSFLRSTRIQGSSKEKTLSIRHARTKTDYTETVMKVFTNCSLTAAMSMFLGTFKLRKEECSVFNQ